MLLLLFTINNSVSITGMTQSLQFCTYNMRGFNTTKISYVKDLLRQFTIVFLVEHWLTNKQLDDLSVYFTGYSVHGVSALNSQVLLQGRPNGGVAILYPDFLNNSAKYIKTSSNRICAISLEFDSIMIYFFCVYMPCDSNEVNNLKDYESILSEISSLCIEYDAHFVCVLGDMNTDFSRVNSRHTQALQQFISYENLCLTLEHPLANISYSYCNTYNNVFSIIDHIFVSQNLSHYIESYYSLCDEVDNQSDHAPIIIKLKIQTESHINVPLIYKPRKQWKSVDLEQIDKYKQLLDTNLLAFKLPIECIQCSDLMCSNCEHVQCIQHLHDNIISACLNASVIIPTVKFKNNTLPGWNEVVKKSKESALFWRSIWIENNRPKQGHVADIMRRTRAKYHYAVRNVKSKNKQYKKQAMARAISENNSRDLWTEVRKIKRNVSSSPNCMDNVNGNANIAELFADKYHDLFNSVKYEQDKLTNMFHANKSDIEKHCITDQAIYIDKHYTHTHNISVEQVNFAIDKLKSEKSDCKEGLTSDNFKNGTHLMKVYISLLFTTMLSHGIAPEGLLLSTIVPILKNKRGNKCDSNNYRAIAISSLLGKLFDIIVLKEQHTSLFTDVLQFGFKPNSSTIICTSVLLETIEYYNEHGSDCYLLLLDASKAFDRVEYVKLFNILRDRNICPVVLRLLMNMYINQKIQIKWNNLISSQNNISNGVKQGGCLSPTLFSIYLNGLIENLRRCNIGCRYGGQYMGVFCYADDLSLICPSYSGIKEMLKICESYAKQFDILFNAKKSQIVFFKGKCKTANFIKPPLQMENGESIPYVDECNHLGNVLSSKSKNTLIQNAINDLYMRTNCLLSDFSFTDSTTLASLFNTYCMNIYGSPLWKHYDHRLLEPFYIAWRQSIRKVWKIPFRTHNLLLQYIHESNSIDIILDKRCVKFLWNLFNSNYNIYNVIAKCSLYNCNTSMGENIRYFMFKYDIMYEDWFNNINYVYNKIDAIITKSVNHENRCVATVIRELCVSRDYPDTHIFEHKELIFMIDRLCTD